MKTQKAGLYKATLAIVPNDLEKEIHCIARTFDEAFVMVQDFINDSGGPKKHRLIDIRLEKELTLLPNNNGK